MESSILKAMNTLLEDILEELESRNAYLAKTYAPYYMASMACHLFNLHNQKHQVYWEGSNLPSMRLHLLFVAPAGFMKTYFLETMLRGKYCILGETIKKTFEATLCLPQGSMIQMADGRLEDIADIKPGDKVMSLGKDWKFTPQEVTDTLEQESELVKVSIENGYSLTCTPNHPLKTLTGWKKAGDLKPGDEVAVARNFDITPSADMDERIVALLGYFTADGTYDQMTFYDADQLIIGEVTRIAESLGCKVNTSAHKPAIEFRIVYKGTGTKNIIKEEFAKIFGCNTSELIYLRNNKYIPEVVFKLPKEKIAVFLKWLFSGDGYTSKDLVQLSNKSENVIVGTRELLKRFNIYSHVRQEEEIWKLFIFADKDKFFEHIGFVGKHANEELKKSNPVGEFPAKLWDSIDNKKGELSWNKLAKEVGYKVSQSKYQKLKLTRVVLEKIAKVLGDGTLKALAGGDVLFRKIKTVEHAGTQPVYNLTCNQSNYVSGGMVVHNTEAGLVGTIGSSQGEVYVEEGAAKEFADGIIGVDEFSAITRMMQTTHSGLLDVQLLSALDSGYVYKRLAHGRLEYTSQFSMWGGVQPSRYDLTSGMGRRFCFLIFLPTRNDSNELLEAWYKSKNKKPNFDNMERIWRRLKQFKYEIGEIKELEFDSKLLKDYQDLGIYPYEGTIFDRLILGMTLLNGGMGKKVFITLRDPEVRNMVTQEIRWRRHISVGGELRQVIKLIEDQGGKITRSRLMQDCFMLGWDLRKLVEILREMEKMRLLSVTREEVVLI